MALMVTPQISSTLPRKIASTPLAGKIVDSILPTASTAPASNIITGTYDKGVECLAKGIGKFADNKYVKGLTQWCVKHNVDYVNHLSAMCANVLNGFYMYNVARSKKIEPEQKKPLMLNMFIGTVLSTIGGYALNGAIDKNLIKPMNDAIKKHYSDKTLESVLSGFRTAKSLMVFQLLYRFVCPVIATPVANHISNKARDKKPGEKGSLMS